MKININEDYADFILRFAKDDGLGKLVTNLSFDENEKSIKIESTEDLKNNFFSKFPNSTIDDLNNTIEWVLVTACAKIKFSGDTNGQVSS